MMKVSDFRDWARWLRSIPSAIADVTRLLSKAEGNVPPSMKTRFLDLWTRFEQTLRGQRITDEREIRFWRGTLAIALVDALDLDPNATDQDILLRAQGVDRLRPDAEKQLEDDATFAKLFSDAEKARNEGKRRSCDC